MKLYFLQYHVIQAISSTISSNYIIKTKVIIIIIVDVLTKSICYFILYYRLGYDSGQGLKKKNARPWPQCEK